MGSADEASHGHDDDASHGSGGDAPDAARHQSHFQEGFDLAIAQLSEKLEAALDEVIGLRALLAMRCRPERAESDRLLSIAIYAAIQSGPQSTRTSAACKALLDYVSPEKA